MKLGQAFWAAAICGAAALPATVAADTLTLSGTIRDFKRGDQSGGHQDFETCNTVSGHGVYGQCIDMVTYALGADLKPAFNHTRPSNDSMYSANSFSQWYNDTPGTNQSMAYSIALSNGKQGSGGTYTYSNSAFFPIDGKLLGNQGQKDANGTVHNFSFTYELHTQFTYAPGQNFNFTGDDDVYVFINGSKVLDLGGVHSAISGNVILFDGKVFSYNSTTQLPVAGIVHSVTTTYASTLAGLWTAQHMTGTCPIKSGDHYIDLTLVSGQTCTLDFFFAERHTTSSDFRIDTSMLLKAAKPLPGYD